MTENAVHFYLKRSKGFSASVIDMQKIDIGIALCHFDLATKDAALNITFTVSDPKIATNADVEYIASYLIEQ